MQPDHVQTADLGAFEPPTADAVVSVLRRRGCPAWADPAAGGDSLVRVPADRREEALALVAAHMEDIAAMSGSAEPGPSAVPPLPGGRPGSTWDAGDSDDPSAEKPSPIVLEQLRRFGLGLAIVLAPLLVITLAAPSLPLRYALVVFVAGLVAVTYWRNRQDR